MQERWSICCGSDSVKFILEWLFLCPENAKMLQAFSILIF